MFYKFDQNNSGGHFVVNDNLCHYLIIEAANAEQAIEMAENLGCYWNGVEHGQDCPCCGDRWYREPDEIDLDKWMQSGYGVSTYVSGTHGNRQEAIELWNSYYRCYTVIKEPVFRTSDFGTTSYNGSIAFKDIEEYAQYLADLWSWTAPDVRIFFSDGTIKEVFNSNGRGRVED